MDFSQKEVRAVLRAYLEDSYLDGSCLPLALAMWRRPRLLWRLLRCRPVPVCGRYPALYGLLLALLRQYGADALCDTAALLTACCRIRPLTVYELRQLPLLRQAAVATWGGKVALPDDTAAAEEQFCIAEKLLSEEPAGIYPHLSPEGRAECRRLVAEQARRQGCSETAVAADVAARAFRDGSHAAALLLADYHRRCDTATRIARAAACSTAGAVAVWLCAVWGEPWLLPPVWAVAATGLLPLSAAAVRLKLPPCRHLPFGRLSPRRTAHLPEAREYRLIHPDAPHALLLTGGRYALLLTDNGSSAAFYRRRALYAPTDDPLLHPTGIFFTLHGDANACATAAVQYAHTAACSVRFEECCARYRYDGNAVKTELTVAVHPDGYGEVRTLRLCNRTSQALRLQVRITLPFAGTHRHDGRSGIDYIRRQGAPIIGVSADGSAWEEGGLCVSLTLPPTQEGQVRLLVAVGVSREEVRCAVDALRENAALLPGAGAGSPLPARFARRVLPALIGPPDCSPAARRALADNTLPPTALQQFGLRRGRPYLLLTVQNATDAARAIPYLRGIRLTYRAGIACAAVIAVTDSAAARAVREALRHSDCLPLCGRRGIIRLVYTPTQAARRLLTAYAAHDAARDRESLGRLLHPFTPLFREEGRFFVRVGNVVRTQGEVDGLRITVRGDTLLLYNPTPRDITCEAALLLSPVGRGAQLVCNGSRLTLLDGDRRLTLYGPDGTVGYIGRRTAFYEGNWQSEASPPYPHPCAVALCRRTVAAGKNVVICWRIHEIPS